MNRNEVVEAMKAVVKRDAYNHIAITCDPESYEFTVERLVTGEKLAGPFSEIAAADDAQHELVIRECMEAALTALEAIMERDGLKVLGKEQVSLDFIREAAAKATLQFDLPDDEYSDKCGAKALDFHIFSMKQFEAAKCKLRGGEDA